MAIGDAGAFIDPFTGSGMLMAMESGELVSQVIENGLNNSIITENYKQLHQQKFQKRLQICRLLRGAAFAPNLAKIVISLLSLTEKPREFLARATRPKLST